MGTFKGTQSAFRGLPPLRAAFDKEDEFDSLRVEGAWALWRSQDEVLRAHDRSVEEAVRMLSGQQWIAYNPVLGRYIDVSEWFTDDEKKWRQRPVLNRLLPWFMLTHSRVTENPPNVTFLAGPDRIDAQLAEAMDTIFKPLWRETGMVDVNDRLFTWVVPAGRAHLQTLVDVTRGRLVPRRGLANVPVFNESDEPVLNERDGTQLTMEEEVPLGSDWEPQAIIRAGQLVPTEEQPVFDREGELEVEVLSPLQVRGQWGAHIPWHRKRWHEVQTFLPVETIWELWGVEVEPDIRGSVFGLDDGGFLEKVMFGSGHYGAAGKRSGSEHGTVSTTEGYAKVLTYWGAPKNDEGPKGQWVGQVETPESPGGRLLVVAKDRCLFDWTRPARFAYTSPVRTFDFVRLPGRPGGSSPLEPQIPIQRSYNRGWGQINEHTNLLANPVGVYDRGAGIKDGQWTNEPGLKLGANARPGVKPLDFIQPPSLGQDTWKRQAMLLAELEYYGQLEGARGSVQAEDPSGELVRELRANSDRPYGATARRSVEEYARLVEDWMAWIPVIWPAGRILNYAGIDNVARTIVVLPEMFKQGKCNVVPDIESMVPETPMAREARIEKMYAGKVFGEPGTPPAVERYLELARFPNMGRMAKVGGIDRTTAERENAQLLQGANGDSIALFPWYSDEVHLMVHESFMKSPEYLQLPEEVQAGFALHWEKHYRRLQQRMLEQAALAAATGAAGQGPPPPSSGAERPEKRPLVRRRDAAQ